MSLATIRRHAVPTAEELVARARDMVPEIRALAQETERNRNLSRQIVERIRKAELLRTCQPAEFGGFEYDGEVALKIALQISAGCASTGWTINVALSNGMVFAHWPIEAQREIWQADADPFSFGCVAPTGAAVPVAGGYRLNGKWSFASGCDFAEWGELGAMIGPPDAASLPDHNPVRAFEGAFFLVPATDCEIVDNWFVCGLSGSGSKDIVVRDAFVPAHRVLLFSDLRPARHRAAAITGTRSIECRF